MARRLAKILRQNPWFHGLTPEHFQKLLAIADLSEWLEGKTIFAEGTQDPRLYLILEGRVAIEKYVPGRGRITLLTLGPNEIFGWSAVVPVIGTRTATARAVALTRAVTFDTVALEQVCDEDHDLGYLVYRRLTNVIAGRLSATRLQLLDMYSLPRT
ncbi:MAG: cyclic nucleotide-binding domain-containing protein [Chloroflexota bacterium]|jgi:CRP-like cAMP-binding protein